MESTAKLKSVKVWRVGVQNQKDWRKWSWSKDYNSLDEIIAIMKPWIETHPGCVVRYAQETRFVL